MAVHPQSSAQNVANTFIKNASKMQNTAAIKGEPTATTTHKQVTILLIIFLTPHRYLIGLLSLLPKQKLAPYLQQVIPHCCRTADSLSYYLKDYHYQPNPLISQHLILVRECYTPCPEQAGET